MAQSTFFFFFHYFQVYCPNNMLQPRAQMGQMHLGQEPTETQVKDIMVGHKILASWTEQAEWSTLQAMHENWEKAGQAVERQQLSKLSLCPCDPVP